MSDDAERTASLMTPAKLAQMKPRAAASPAAWLDQMASDAGHLHVRHLKEMSERLRAEAVERDYSAVTSALGGLAQALPQLDFSLLEPKGWLARATGKAKSAGAEFMAQYERVAEAVKAMKQRNQTLVKEHLAQGSTNERALVEFEVEWRAIEKILDQGARWLQDMRNQLKTRQAASPDLVQQQQIDEDAARCEILVARLKLLRAVAAGAQQVHQQAQVAATRRSALLQALQQLHSTHLKAWESAVSPLAKVAADGGAKSLDLDSPADAHKALRQRVGQLADDCKQLQVEEQVLADQLGALGEQLKSAA